VREKKTSSIEVKSTKRSKHHEYRTYSTVAYHHKGNDETTTPCRVLCKRNSGSAWQRSITQHSAWRLKQLRVSRSMMNSLIKREGLPVHRFGRRVLIDPEELRPWLTQRRAS